MQSRNSLFLPIVLVLTALAILGYFKSEYHYGIDVQGGIRMVYSISQTPESIAAKHSLDTDRAAAIRVLGRRVEQGIGVVEGTVQAKGANQIVVELPGFTDRAEARKIMGSTARLQAFDATNVSTKLQTRRYTEDHEEVVDGMPVVFFRKFGQETPIGPKDPEYQKIIAEWGTPILQGTDLADAHPLTQGNGRVVPEFIFSSSGAAKMEKWSRSVLNRGENLAFVIDGKVLNIAPLKDGAILREEAFIDGQFEPAAVSLLTGLLRDGALEVIMVPESEQSVDASIGKGALKQIVVAGVASFVLICAFLIVYYSVPGVIASLAMVLYCLFTITALKLLGATFSLAAIAAFILSVGMAVDANILVFERIKEELRAGRPLATAVELGFKRALSAIIDSNACAILTSLVLFILGSGPVKGFATTLIYGVLISFFTAFTVTRALVLTGMKIGVANDPKYYALGRNWFGEKFEAGADAKPIDILGRTKLWFTISAALIVIGWTFVAMGGIKPNVELLGGYEGIYKVDQGATLGQIRTSLAHNGLSKANVQLGTAEDKVTHQQIPVAYIRVGPHENVSKDIETANGQIAQAAGLKVENSLGLTNIGATIQGETITNAYLGIIIASGLIIIYIALRFGIALGGMKNGMKFGVSAIAALLHDALFVVGVAGVVGMTLGWEVSALFITAMLTVIGFSVHDTIIIFDRIRENLRRPHKGETFEHLIDKSVTQTIARSINTSMTAFVTLVILVIFGTTVPELKFMCLTMAAGIAVGTYSSIFNASPILWLWNKAAIKRHGQQADLMEEAQREAKLRAKIAMDTDSDKVYKDETAAAYGQIKRKTSAADKATRPVDED